MVHLIFPRSVVLDADGNLFVSDSGNARIVMLGPNGFRCIAACMTGPASSSYSLNEPGGIAFDSFGNIFVADTSNNRIQMFLLLSNSFGKLSIWWHFLMWEYSKRSFSEVSHRKIFDYVQSSSFKKWLPSRCQQPPRRKVCIITHHLFSALFNFLVSVSSRRIVVLVYSSDALRFKVMLSSKQKLCQWQLSFIERVICFSSEASSDDYELIPSISNVSNQCIVLHKQ